MSFFLLAISLRCGDDPSTLPPSSPPSSSPPPSPLLINLSLEEKEYHFKEGDSQKFEFKLNKALEEEIIISMSVNNDEGIKQGEHFNIDGLNSDSTLVISKGAETVPKVTFRYVKASADNRVKNVHLTFKLKQGDGKFDGEKTSLSLTFVLDPPVLVSIGSADSNLYHNAGSATTLTFSLDDGKLAEEDITISVEKMLGMDVKSKHFDTNIGDEVVLPEGQNSVEVTVEYTNMAEHDMPRELSFTFEVSPGYRLKNGGSTESEVTLNFQLIYVKPGQVTVTANKTEAEEGESIQLTFRVEEGTTERTELIKIEVSHRYDGSTADRDDYNLSPEDDVTIPVGTSEATLTVNFTSDDTLEYEDETLVLNYSIISGTGSLLTTSSTLTIRAQLPSSISVSRPIGVYQEGKTALVFFSIIPLRTDTDVNIQVTRDARSTADTKDYFLNPANGIVTIPRGEARSAPLKITFLEDDDTGDTEELFLNLAITSPTSGVQFAALSSTTVHLRINPGEEEGDLDLVQYVDPFIGTEYTHGDGYQPSRVYPLVSEPFGMVVFTVANAFHSGAWYNPPNDWGGSKTSGRQLPTYVGDGSKIKGFSAFSFQGPGCNLAHDFLMMPAVGTTGSTDWLSNKANGNATDDFKIKSRRIRQITKDDREASKSNEDREWAEPGYYRVKTKKNVLIEITATKRTGIMRITYPTGVSKGYFHLASYTRTESFDNDNSSVEQSTVGGSSKGLEGKIRAGKFCGEGGEFRYEMFMSGEFDRAYSSPKTRSDKNEIKVEFDLSTNRTVHYKFGLSFVSLANARENMHGVTVGGTSRTGENTSFAFDTIQTNTSNRWNALLNKVKVKDSHDGTGGSNYATRTSDKRRLYTYLFRSMIHPNIFSDLDGTYTGFDGSAESGSNAGKPHTLPASQGAQYQYFSNWDIYRSQIPLVAFLDKDVGRDIILSLVNNADQAGNNNNSGGFTRWGVANHDSGVMGGDPASIMVSTLHAFGATLSTSDADKVIAVFKRSGRLEQLDLHRRYTSDCSPASTSLCYLQNNSNHYRGGVLTTNIRSGVSSQIYSSQINNNPFSKIVELAMADYARSTFIQREVAYKSRAASKETELTTLAGQFKTSSKGWQQLFRSGSASFKSGTTKNNRMVASSRCQWHGTHGCFHEGTRDQYQWSVPHHPLGADGLFKWMGMSNSYGADDELTTNSAMEKKLDDHFAPNNLVVGENGNTYNAGNQVGFGTPYMYHYIGLPNETTNVVRNKLGKYYPDNFVAYPGNEDGGSMSAQFVWGFIGLYPHTLSTDRLFLLYPAFDYIEIDLSDGAIQRKLILKRDPASASTANSSSKNACIEKITADGYDTNTSPDAASIQNDHNLTKNYISYQNISETTTLSFKIVARKSGSCDHTTWGKKKDDLPPSFENY